jgi:hypothetical protein
MPEWDISKPSGGVKLSLFDDQTREKFDYLESALKVVMRFAENLTDPEQTGLIEGTSRIAIGLDSGRPVFSSANDTGKMYFATDTGALYICTVGADNTWILVQAYGDGVPTGSVAGLVVGQRYFDETNVGWWTCTVIGSPGTWAPDIAPKTVQMFAGHPVNDMPAGWLLCDGSAGTPDLGGRFIAGYDSGDADYNGVDPIGSPETGGAKTYGNIAHTHTIGSAYTYSGGEGGHYAWGGGTHGTLTATGSSGSGTGENRPPWHVLAYIIKKPVV